MEVKFFGEFEAVESGVPAPFRGAKQRTVLALLALHRGKPVSADLLIDALWGDRQVANPVNAFTEAYDGYLLGSKTLGQEVTYLEGLFRQGAAYLVRNDGWTGQPWASSLPSSP